MNPPPYFRPLHPPRPPPPYQPLQPPIAAPNSMYPFNLHPSRQCETSSSFASDLPSALSALTSLLQLTRTTLNSISNLIPTPSNSSTPLVACPFNPNHLVPAASLFSHYLSCPSSNSPLSADDLLHSLQYPSTLHSSATNPSAQPLENPNSADFCFSLENFLNSSNNFFYADCPGPVRVDNCYNGTSYSLPMLTLPGFLYTSACTSECTDLTGFSVESIRLLASEIWAVGEEMNGWNDYPVSYSHRILRTILRLGTSTLLCLPKWVIMNSPNYGVIIDLAMSDHIVLLFKLCLKAVIGEATKSASSLFTGDGEQKQLCGHKREFDCPVLISSMRWLGFQLSVLYGELNGKLFTINILKQCVLDSALNSSVFPVVEKTMESPELMRVDGELERSVGKIEGDECKIMENGVGVNNSTISVSQVAAAVAALHERSWLERKIRALRDSRSLTAYQRMVEHEYISKRANDERQKRLDYRPVIEHDGLLLQRNHNQESNRIKTREELLAEERDYKRRRMSYRGKKMKRSTTLVMRDIIDEHMEQIKQASNVAEGAKEVESRASVYDSSSNAVKYEEYQSTFEASRVDSHEAHRDYHKSTDLKNKYIRKDKHHRRDTDQRHGFQENERSIKSARHDRREYSRSPDQWLGGSERSIMRDRHDREEYSRSSDQQCSSSHSQGHRTNRGNREVITNEKLPRSSERSRSMSYGQKSHHREEKEHNSEHRDKCTKRKHEHRVSASSHDDFEDRYTPFESHDTYEDNDQIYLDNLKKA